MDQVVFRSWRARGYDGLAEGHGFEQHDLSRGAFGWQQGDDDDGAALEPVEVFCPRCIANYGHVRGQGDADQVLASA